MQTTSLVLGILGAVIVLWGAVLGARVDPARYTHLGKMSGALAHAQDVLGYMQAQARSARWVVTGSALQFVAVVLAFAASR